VPQVLSDPTLKEKYDKFGKEGIVPEGGFMNPTMFFNNMFGGGKFSEFIGEMTFSLDPSDQTSAIEKEQIQKERVITLAAHLIRRLDLFVQGNVKEFEASVKGEISNLRNETHGVELLHHIGYIYEQEAKQHMGGISGLAEQLFERAHMMRENVAAVKAAEVLQQAQKQINEADEEKRAEIEAKYVDEGLMALWKMGKFEVENVLRKVCEVVLGDTTLDKKRLKLRTEGLKLLGKTLKTA